MGISELFLPGNKVELNINSRTSPNDPEQIREIKYFTSVYECPDEEHAVVYMPMEKGKLILVPNGMSMEMMAHSDRGMFKCDVKVRERYRTGNKFLMKLEILSKPVKYQRRDYYRCDCLIDFDFRVLSNNPALPPLTWQTIDDYIDDPDSSEIYTGTMLDISGGGMRASSKVYVEKGRIVLVSFVLPGDKTEEDLILFGRVLSCDKDDLLNVFETRIQFVQISETEREKIVKFIFENERRARSVQKGREL